MTQSNLLAVEDSSRRMHQMVREQQDRDGYALQRYFYRSPATYAHELETIMFRSWLYAGHVSQLSAAGDFFQYEVGEDAFIVTRGHDNRIHALVNSCRHRGARVCEDAEGSRRSFVCPYHGWSYDLDGSLRGARHMDEVAGFDPGAHGLRRLRVVERHGLIFVNADPEAFDFNHSLDLIDHGLRPHSLATARLAHRQTYRIQANWKFVLENYLECYHCATAHRAYSRLHSLKDPRPQAEPLRAALLARCETLSGVPGISRTARHIYAEAPGFGSCAQYDRYALFDDCVTGSRDGKPVAPLMGEFKGYDGGAGDYQLGPLTFMLNYPDHCVLYRITPRAIDATEMEIVWFVDGKAEEGRDYQLEDLTWLWHHTTLEDDFIVRRNSAGANSYFYEPGPYHPEFESTSLRFIRWYLDALGSTSD
jgi:phenylpropionate dioxygenase-like ring-hydroxylating dioxygenase large terminal subunit